MINFEPKTPWRFHIGSMAETDSELRRHLYTERPSALLANQQPYKLVADWTRLLPFQIHIPAAWAKDGDLVIKSIKIMGCDGAEVPIPHLLLSKMELFQSSSDGLWWIYKAESGILNSSTGFLNSGKYYRLVVKFQSGRTAWSEWIWLPKAQPEFKNYVKMEWWNDCDTGNIIYQTGYKNLIYLDTDVVQNQPTIEETGIENGYGEFVQTGSRWVDNYSVEDVVPEFVMQALLMLRMHEKIKLTLPHLVQNGFVRAAKITATPEKQGNLYTIDMTLEQDIRLIKYNCCGNKRQSEIFSNPNTKGGLGGGIKGAGGVTPVLTGKLEYGGLPSLTFGLPDAVIESVQMKPTKQGGWVDIQPNGDWLYRAPFEGFMGVDSFEVVVNKQGERGQIYTHTVVSDIIRAGADRYTLTEPAPQGYTFPISVLANDFIPYDYPHEWPIVGNGQSMDLYYQQTLQSGNRIDLNRETGELTIYTAGEPNLPEEQFTYAIYDENGEPIAAQITIVYDFGGEIDGREFSGEFSEDFN